MLKPEDLVSSGFTVTTHTNIQKENLLSTTLGFWRDLKESQNLIMVRSYWVT